MKNYMLTALVLGLTLISCSKQKSEMNAENDTMSTVNIPADTTTALPPSDTAAMNAHIQNDSANTSTARDSANNISNTSGR